MDAADILAIAGLVQGFASIILSVQIGLKALAESRMSETQLNNYIHEMHGQMLARFDRLDSKIDGMGRILPEGEASE